MADDSLTWLTISVAFDPTAKVLKVKLPFNITVLGPATNAQLVFGGSMSTGAPSTTPPNLNVDLRGEWVELQFTDAHGNVLPDAAGATVQFNSSDTNVATLTQDPNNSLRADIAFPGAAGSFDLSVALSGVTDPSGNAIPAPAPVTLTVNPGAPAGARLEYGQDQPAAAPSGPAAPVPTAPTAPTVTDPTTGVTTPAGGAPAAETRSVYTYEGDSSVVDGTLWPKAPVQTTDSPPRPLYYYANDQAPGDHNGDGIGNVWHLYTGPTQPSS